MFKLNLNPSPCLYFYLNKCIWLSADVSKSYWMGANNVDPDQTRNFAASDLGLHRLFRSFCPNTLSRKTWLSQGFVFEKFTNLLSSFHAGQLAYVHFSPASADQSDARPTGEQEIAGSIPAVPGTILSRRLIMKYFLRLFFPIRWFKKDSYQFLAEEWAQVLVYRFED